MGAFGDRLRREREMRGVTLDEIAESTKISKRSLQALEEDDFDLLPGGIFNKGFIRAYARYLGIDEDQTVADYVAASNEQPAPEDQFPLEVFDDKEKNPPLNPKRSFLPIVLAIVALAAGVGGWAYYAKYKPRQRVPVAEQVPAPNIPAPALPAPSSSTSQAQTEVTPGTNPPATQSTGQDQKNASVAATGTASTTGTPEKTSGKTSTDKTSKTQKPAVNAEQQKDTTASESESASGKLFTVSVKAKEDSWISITADGKFVREGVLSANRQWSARAGKELVLKIGNAPGIEVSYQGKPLGPLPADGKVRTLTFNASGLKQ
jgi:cytoskeleton protein RodZ